MSSMIFYCDFLIMALNLLYGNIDNLFASGIIFLGNSDGRSRLEKAGGGKSEHVAPLSGAGIAVNGRRE